MASAAELNPSQVWRDYEGDLLRLDRSVPGDASAWYADVWIGGDDGHWSHEDHVVEPGDLTERLEVFVPGLGA